MKWDPLKARLWLYKTGFELISDGLFHEGGELLYESKYGTDCDKRSGFISIIATAFGNDSQQIKLFLKEVSEMKIE